MTFGNSAPGGGFIKKSPKLLTLEDLEKQKPQKVYTLELDQPETIPEDKLALYTKAKELRVQNTEGGLTFYYQDRADMEANSINRLFSGDIVATVKRSHDGRRDIYRVSCDWEKMKSYYCEILNSEGELITEKRKAA